MLNRIMFSLFGMYLPEPFRSEWVEEVIAEEERKKREKESIRITIDICRRD